MAKEMCRSDTQRYTGLAFIRLNQETSKLPHGEKQRKVIRNRRGRLPITGRALDGHGW